MSPRERNRLSEIERRLTDLASMAPHTYARYYRALKEKQALDREIAELRAEQADLEQGQLLLHCAG